MANDAGAGTEIAGAGGTHAAPPTGDAAKAVIAAAEAAAKAGGPDTQPPKKAGNGSGSGTAAPAAGGEAQPPAGTGATANTSAPEEAIARIQGWTPKEDWVKQGKDAAQWKDAKAFLTYGEKNNALLKERVGSLTQKIQELEGRALKGEQAAKDLAELSARASARGYERARKELLDQHAQAVKDGDGAAAAESLDKLDKLEKPKPVVAEAAPGAGAAPEGPRPPPKEFVDWKEKNAWYGTDAEMTKHADRIGRAMAIEHAQEKKPVVAADFVAAVEAEVRARYPERFRSQGAAPPSPDAGGGSGGGGGVTKVGKSWDDLPAADKAAGERIINTKYRGKPIMTREQYLKDYFGE